MFPTSMSCLPGGARAQGDASEVVLEVDQPGSWRLGGCLGRQVRRGSRP